MLRLTGITRSFGATKAVADVSLSVAAGEIVGLVGQNGAGKTTLMRILAGEIRPDRGSMAIDGAPVTFRSPRDADARGIELVHQELLLVDDFTIAENIALTWRDRFRFASRRAMERRAAEAIACTGLTIGDVTRRAAELSIGERARLELAKALAKKPRFLILDEPTSVLTPNETAELFDVVRRVAAEGTAVIFISHKLPEVLSISDRIVVMREGRIVAEARAAGT
ncbi:MAG TPA: ATP-binding cassette domain-containing protein, partial [Thermoanaerobaculia bacterium]|nr:ATP-binding cassette domain-containing protein [Thermoanaerobaculia bacterium]